MKKITKISGLLLLLIILLSSCDSKEDAVRDLLVLRTEIKNNSYTYTSEDWEDALNRYFDICQRLNETPFNREEQLDIDKVKGEIAGYAASSASQQVVDAVESISEELAAFADGFENTFKEPNRKE